MQVLDRKTAPGLCTDLDVLPRSTSIAIKDDVIVVVCDERLDFCFGNFLALSRRPSPSDGSRLRAFWSETFADRVDVEFMIWVWEDRAGPSLPGMETWPGARIEQRSVLVSAANAFRPMPEQKRWNLRKAGDAALGRDRGEADRRSDGVGARILPMETDRLFRSGGDRPRRDLDPLGRRRADRHRGVLFPRGGWPVSGSRDCRTTSSPRRMWLPLREARRTTPARRSGWGCRGRRRCRWRCRASLPEARLRAEDKAVVYDFSQAAVGSHGPSAHWALRFRSNGCGGYSAANNPTPRNRPEPRAIGPGTALPRRMRTWTIGPVTLSGGA